MAASRASIFSFLLSACYTAMLPDAPVSTKLPSNVFQLAIRANCYFSRNFLYYLKVTKFFSYQLPRFWRPSTRRLIESMAPESIPLNVPVEIECWTFIDSALSELTTSVHMLSPIGFMSTCQ
ncbi:hypothetical protein B0H19DRAFT_1102948 [Mycena capillaripes]|nr:hypothetical protein B0H19DRAFT_1102948 [Mycena capillaripes]